MRRVAWLLPVILVSGCAMFVRAPESAPAVSSHSAQALWQQRSRRLAQLDHFQLEARMAVTGQGWSGSLRWQQDGDNLKLVVTGPLGVGGLRATGTVNRVYVETGDEAFWTDDPEATFQQRVGWLLPIRFIRYWALGIPAPGLPETHTLDAEGHLVTLQQAGWQLRYAGYQQHGDVDLPHAIVFTGAQAEIRVVIDSWKP